MVEMKAVPGVALLVDIVASRTAPRDALHEDVLSAVEATNSRLRPVHTLRPTVGDELQGVYHTLGEALLAGFTLRLELAPRWEARCGIGGGDVVVVDDVDVVVSTAPPTDELRSAAQITGVEPGSAGSSAPAARSAEPANTSQRPN